MTHCPLALKYKFTMNLKSTLLLLLCLMMAGMVAAKDNTKVIAHRGYWKTEGSAQNSIRSLERASEIGAYGNPMIPRNVIEMRQGYLCKW